MIQKNNINNKIDGIFLLSPLFFTIISGALIGATINLITGLIYSKEMLSYLVIISILFLFISSLLFVYISIVIEQLHSKAKDKSYLRNMIFHHRTQLWSTTFVSFAFIAISIVLLILAVKN